MLSFFHFIAVYMRNTGVNIRISHMKRLLLFLLLNTLCFFCTAQSIILNEGNQHTNQRKIPIEFRGVNISHMIISDNIINNTTQWKTFRRRVSWDLTGREGKHYIYFKFKYENGKISKNRVAEITLDFTPPTIHFVDIATGFYTNQTNVTIKFAADQANYIRVSNSNNFHNSSWFEFVDKIPWSLEGGEGKKTIYIQMKDKAGNISQTYTRDILLDMTPPQNVSLSIESQEIVYDSVSGVKYFNPNKDYVSLKISAQDAEYMAINNQKSLLFARWMNYQPSIPHWKIDNRGQGMHHVYVWFKDKAQNISELAQDVIFIDTEPPQVIRININKGAEYTTKNTVTLELLARQAKAMMLSENSDFSGATFEPYTPSKEWSLSSGQGLKTVYIIFADKAHNLTDTLTRKIILDTQAPQSVDMLVNKGKQTTAVPHIKLEVKAQGASAMQVSEKKSFKGVPWRTYHTDAFDWELLSNGFGIKHIYIRCKDAAGNISDIQEHTINYIIKPVRASVRIDHGAEFCNQTEKKVILSLFAVYANEMMISPTADFRGVQWESYRATKEWVLSGKDGIKTVYVKYRSHTETESVVCRDKIVLDRVPPTDINFNMSLKDSFSPYCVELTPFTQGASYMQISESADFKNVRWFYYSNLPFTFTLSPGQGKKTVYMRFKDDYENISQVISQSINLDLSAPTKHKVLVNGGVKVVNSPDVSLNINVHLAKEMRISNSREILKTVPWQNYQEVKSWQLDSQQGMQTVFIQFRDEQKNTSKIVETCIALDTEKPVNASFCIREGKYCNRQDRSVNLSLHANAATRMIISNYSTFEDATWIKYADNYKNWKLSSGDGLKNIYVKFADEAGNQTETFRQKITLDRKISSENTFVINQDNRFTNEQQVTLDFKCISEVSEMMISMKPDFIFPARWETFALQKKWYLNLPDGNKIIYVKFRDKAGNETQPVQNNIILDTEAPIPHYIQINRGATAVDGTRVTLYTKVKDVKQMKISNQPLMDNLDWVPYFSEKNWTLSGVGLQKIYIIFQDAAGNISKPFYDEITAYE